MRVDERPLHDCIVGQCTVHSKAPGEDDALIYIQ